MSEGRPEFQTMLNDISEGKDNVQYVLVFKLSRFGRNAADVLNSLQLMQDWTTLFIAEKLLSGEEKRKKFKAAVMNIMW